MKTLLFLLFSLIFLFTSNSYLVFADNSDNLEIHHFFSHELVYNTSLAFKPSNSLRHCFDKDHITTTEFRNILLEFYHNNYILVDIDDVYDVVDNKLVVKPNLNFNGKKPLILSFDDLSYDTKNRGIIEKLIVRDNEFYDFTSCEENKITQDRDIVTILESFIKRYPDFAYNNARAILCVTGYNGAFGYRVFEDTYLKNDELNKEKNELQNLISLLKERGYKFASHSYGHINNINTSSKSFINDCLKWKNEIGQFIGQTNIYCYPGGIHQPGSFNNNYLKDNGFNIFLCTGPTPKKIEILEENATYLYRHPLDGNSLRNCQTEYAQFFDCLKVYDKSRYLPFK